MPRRGVPGVDVVPTSGRSGDVPPRPGPARPGAGPLSGGAPVSLITTLARLEARRSGRAQPAATVRHRHLSERPLVFVPLTTAGEAGAPLGALVGTERDAPRLLVVPQPRDRDLRFAFLAELADVVLPYIDSYADDVEAAERNET